jgi:hypothetical protein
LPYTSDRRASERRSKRRAVVILSGMRLIVAIVAFVWSAAWLAFVTLEHRKTKIAYTKGLTHAEKTEKLLEAEALEQKLRKLLEAG